MTKLTPKEKIDLVIKALEKDDREVGMLVLVSLITDFFENQETLAVMLTLIAETLAARKVEDTNQGKLAV